MDRLRRNRPGNRLVTRHGVTTCLRTCSRFPQVLSIETRTSQLTPTMRMTNENIMKTNLYTFYETLLLSLVRHLRIFLRLRSHFILRLFSCLVIFHPDQLHHVLRHEVIGEVPRVQCDGPPIPPNLPQLPLHITEPDPQIIPQPLDLHQNPLQPIPNPAPRPPLVPCPPTLG